MKNTIIFVLLFANSCNSSRKISDETGNNNELAEVSVEKNAVLKKILADEKKSDEFLKLVEFKLSLNTDKVDESKANCKISVDKVNIDSSDGKKVMVAKNCNYEADFRIVEKKSGKDLIVTQGGKQKFTVDKVENKKYILTVSACLKENLGTYLKDSLTKCENIPLNPNGVGDIDVNIDVQLETSKTLQMWSDSSEKFSTSAFGGEGPDPRSQEGADKGIKCQLKSRWLEFQTDTNILKKNVCNDTAKGIEVITKTLDASQQKKLFEILSSISGEKKSFSGIPCRNGAPVHNSIQINTKNGIANVFELESEQPCGDDTGKFIYAKISNFDFLNSIESLLQ